MKIRFTNVNLIFLAAWISVANVYSAPQAPRGFGVEGQLGKVTFPTSCSPFVQPAFEHAVALLHSFQYQEAGSGFADVALKDPHCAMAYWGEAMSLYHQLWEHPGAETLKKGKEDLDKAKSIGARTEREIEFISAAATFFQDTAGISYKARALAYSKAMEQVYLHNPSDIEAAAFYALSLIAIPGDGSDLNNRENAIAILDQLFFREPDHPGVAHYLIHASDMPKLASLGLDAARRYAKIAPGSAHALHMPSHIFTRLGLWRESIESNLASAAAGARMTANHLEGATYQLHATDFLHYAYLQTGQVAKARQLQQDLNSVQGATAERMVSSQSTFAIEDAIEQHHWKHAAKLAGEVESGDGRDWSAGDKAEAYWASALGAARSGDADSAREDVEKLKKADADWKAKMKEYSASGSEGIDVQEVMGWLELAKGKPDQALKTLGAAADQEDKEGVDSLHMPAREMLGDMLLELQKPAAALTAFEVSLAESPNRFDGLYGAARAAELSGAREKARIYYSKLEDQCTPGSDERPELRDARKFLAQYGGPAKSGEQESKQGH